MKKYLVDPLVAFTVAVLDFLVVFVAMRLGVIPMSGPTLWLSLMPLYYSMVVIVNHFWIAPLFSKLRKKKKNK
jgi:hypothetical protein